MGAMAICVTPRPLTPDPSPTKGEVGGQSTRAGSPVGGRGGPGEDSTAFFDFCHIYGVSTQRGLRPQPKYGRPRIAQRVRTADVTENWTENKGTEK